MRWGRKWSTRRATHLSKMPYAYHDVAGWPGVVNAYADEREQMARIDGAWDLMAHLLRLKEIEYVEIDGFCWKCGTKTIGQTSGSCSRCAVPEILIGA